MLTSPDAIDVRPCPGALRRSGRPATAPRTARVLRDATTADAPAIAAIYNASLRNMPYQATPEGAARGAQWLDSELRALGDSPHAVHPNHVGPWTIAMMEGWINLHHGCARPLWLAECEDEPVGWFSFLGFSDRPGGAGAAEVAFYVAPRWNGLGVASTMLVMAKAAAPQLGIDRLMAYVWDDNAASQAVLRRAGFERWGRLPGVIQAFGKRRDMLILGTELAAAS